MNSDIKVLDNIVSKAYQDYIEDTISSRSFPWYYDPNITYAGDSSDPASGFSHFIFFDQDKDTGSCMDKVFPLLLQGIDRYKSGTLLKSLFRIRAVMFIRNQNILPHLSHIDRPDKHYNMIYYVNDSDGPTRIFSKVNKDRLVKEVKPKKGRALIFPGEYFHSSSTPKITSRRMIINYNFLI